jgi:hypothetical protein
MFSVQQSKLLMVIFEWDGVGLLTHMSPGGQGWPHVQTWPSSVRTTECVPPAATCMFSIKQNPCSCIWYTSLFLNSKDCIHVHVQWRKNKTTVSILSTNPSRPPLPQVTEQFANVPRTHLSSTCHLWIQSFWGGCKLWESVKQMNWVMIRLMWHTHRRKRAEIPAAHADEGNSVVG